MADFNYCFAKVLILEGGYILHNVQGDNGGQTYAGISRNKNKTWPGWDKVDLREFDDELKIMVRDFYKVEIWDKISGDAIGSGEVAFQLYDFAINAGLKTAIKLCQKTIGIEQDGIFGKNTFKALNAFVADKTSEFFVLQFSLLKVFRYKDICLNDPRRENDMMVSNEKFLCGWINRVEAGLT
jgi:lysozyme family protein